MTIEDVTVGAEPEAETDADTRTALLLADARTERAKAARALLARPLLRTGAEEFRLVRKYAAVTVTASASIVKSRARVFGPSASPGPKQPQSICSPIA